MRYRSAYNKRSRYDFSGGGDGSPSVGFTPSLLYSDERNSMYIGMGF